MVEIQQGSASVQVRVIHHKNGSVIFLDRGWLLPGDISDDGTVTIISKSIGSNDNSYAYDVEMRCECDLLQPGDVFKIYKL